MMHRLSRSRVSKSASRHIVPRVECLEDRCVPSALTYSSFFGGNTSDEIKCIATDVTGNIYVAGRAGSDAFPGIAGARPPQANGFVAKFDPTATNLLWATYIKSDTTGVHAIAVDKLGNAFVTGTTGFSTGFSTLGTAQATYGGNMDAFVVKLSSSGAIVFSTYLGGNQLDVGEGIAVDSAGNAIVTGYTISANFPTKNPLTGQSAYHPNAGEDAFVTKVKSDGTQFLFSTYLGGNTNSPGENGATATLAYAITVDSADNIFLTGETSAADFPTSLNAFQTTKGVGQNVFVTKIDAANTQILFSTFLGGPGSGNNRNVGRAIAVDRLGNIFVTGETTSTKFPLKSAYQTKINRNGIGGLADAFLTKLNPNAMGAAQMVFSTLLGGSANDFAHAIALDVSGNAYITGQSNSGLNFPLVNPFEKVFYGGAFFAKFSSAGKLTVSSYFGAGGEDGQGIVATPFGNVIFAGGTGSPRMRTTANAYQPIFPGLSDSGFIAVFPGAANKIFNGIDADGDLYTVQLTGAGGVNVVTNDPLHGGTTSVYLHNTNPASSILTVRLTKKIGDGFINLGGIFGTGAIKISATTTNLVGDGINLTGRLGSVYVRDIADGAGILGTNLATQGSNLFAHVVGNGVTIQTGGPFGTLRAARINGATINALRITTLSVTGDTTLGLRGDMKATITLTGTGTALTTASIAGAVTDSTIQVLAGNVSSFRAGAFINSTLFLGQGGILTTDRVLSTFTVAGIVGLATPVFVNSNVSAAIVGTVTLASVDTNNGGTKFGVRAAKRITKVRVISPVFNYNPKLPTPQGLGDFEVKIA